MELAIGIAPLFGAHFDMRSVALDTTTTTENTVEYGKTVLVIFKFFPEVKLLFWTEILFKTRLKTLQSKLLDKIKEP